VRPDPSFREETKCFTCISAFPDPEDLHFQRDAFERRLKI
jgi:hypothetical protein